MPPRTAPTAPAAAPDDLAAIQQALPAWFAANGRDLPWRRTRDPYAVLVSEVMLQQIQVGRASPYYLAFLERFPTIRELAAAPLAEAIRVWGDLGRCRRVVALHRTARIVVEEHGGQVPRDPAVLRSLPGIGPCTAGAVACFAFEDDAAFVDTNIRRVLHRLFVGPDVPAATAGERALLALAAAVVPPGRAWVWNQALIDFGALHCTARGPACGTCPVRDRCRAYPTIVAALAARPRPAPRSASSFRYDDFKRARCRPLAPDGERARSRAAGHRYYRGRVLEALRELPPDDGAGIELRALGPRLREDFGDDDLPWLEGVVESLEKDGLAIAEERPVYDAGPGTATVVTLPEEPSHELLRAAPSPGPGGREGC